MSKVHFSRWIAPLSLVFTMLPAAAAPLGTAFTYQGALRESGQPATGLYDLQVCLFDTPATPVPLSCAADFADVPVEDGLFSLTLDFGALHFIGEQRYLELRVRAGASSGGYTILSPRQLVRPAPEALRASAASAAPWSGLTGVPSGFADGVDDVGGGGITSITAGAGLTGGIITTSGTLAVDTAVIQSRVSGNCVAGQYVRQVNANGTVVCGTDASNAGTVTSITAGTGLSGGTITSTGTLAVNPAVVQSRVTGTCPTGNYLRAVNADGTVVCDSLPGKPTLTVVDDPANAVGTGVSITIGNDGLPVMSYMDLTATALKVAKCSNVACTGPATITQVDDVGPDIEAGETSIAIGADGFPIISYTDTAAGTLRVAKCANAACTGTATVTTVDDPTARVGRYSSILIGSDDLPIISYFNTTQSTLKTLHCTNAACTGPQTSFDVDSNGGMFTSMVIGSNGFPLISYRSLVANQGLRVFRCFDLACSFGGFTTVYGVAGITGWHSSIALRADGKPVVSSADMTAQTLRVSACTTTDCTGAATQSLVDTIGVGNCTSIAVDSDGLPVIGYMAEGSYLRFARCSKRDCTGSVAISTVDAAFTAAQPLTCDMAIGADGLPIMAYADEPTGSLRVAHCGTRNCQ